MTLLQQISEQFEAAKRELFDYELSTPLRHTIEHIKLSEAYRCWGYALHLAQAQKGNFVG